MTHQVIEEWVDASGEEIRDARNVGKHDVDTHEKVVAAERLFHYFPVDRHDALSMERCPAKEKSDNDDN